jgi:hypothetical protein
MDQRRFAGTRRDQDALGAFAADYSPGAIGADRNFQVAANPDSWKPWGKEKTAEELIAEYGEEKNIIGREVSRDAAPSRGLRP